MDDDFEFSLEFVKALEGDRTAALQLWKEIADGQCHDEALAFVREMAARIVAADDEKGARRAEAMLAAVGLSGKIDRNRELREWAQCMRDFGASRSDLIARARHVFPRLVHLEDAQLAKRIDSELAKGEL